MADFGFHNNGSASSFKPDKEKKTIASFSSLENKDGTTSDSLESREERKKYTVDEILDKEIIVTEIRVRKSKEGDGEYLTLKFTDENGEKSFVNTGSATIRDQLNNKVINPNEPFSCHIGKKKNQKGTREYSYLY